MFTLALVWLLVLSGHCISRISQFYCQYVLFIKFEISFRPSLTHRGTNVMLTARELFLTATKELNAFAIPVRKLLPCTKLCKTGSWLVIFSTDMMPSVTVKQHIFHSLQMALKHYRLWGSSHWIHQIMLTSGSCPMSGSSTLFISRCNREYLTTLAALRTLISVIL